MEIYSSHEEDDFINGKVMHFHQNKLIFLNSINLDILLEARNSYLFIAKNYGLIGDYINIMFNDLISSFEKKLFYDFLKELAMMISKKTYNGWKSEVDGIDQEYFNEGTHYLISIKNNYNWGTTSQHKKQEDDFICAVEVLKKFNNKDNIQPVLGVCFGQEKTQYFKNYLKIVGKEFWHLISGRENFYDDVIKLLIYSIKKDTYEFDDRKCQLLNIFTEQFIKKFCENGVIDWVKLVEFNSGNFDFN